MPPRKNQDESPVRCCAGGQSLFGLGLAAIKGFGTASILSYYKLELGYSLIV